MVRGGLWVDLHWGTTSSLPGSLRVFDFVTSFGRKELQRRHHLVVSRGNPVRFS